MITSSYINKKSEAKPDPYSAPKNENNKWQYRISAPDTNKFFLVYILFTPSPYKKYVSIAPTPGSYSTASV